jgi:hypothetical protein
MPRTRAPRRRRRRGGRCRRHYEPGLSKFANHASAARGSAACCAESLWLSGPCSILPTPPRHGKAKPFRTDVMSPRLATMHENSLQTFVGAGLVPALGDHEGRPYDGWPRYFHNSRRRSRRLASTGASVIWTSLAANQPLRTCSGPPSPLALGLVRDGLRGERHGLGIAQVVVPQRLQIIVQLVHQGNACRNIQPNDI